MGVVASYGTVSARGEDKRHEYLTDDEDERVDRSRVSQMSQPPPQHAGGTSYDGSDSSFVFISKHEDSLSTTMQHNTTVQPSTDGQTNVIQQQDDDTVVVRQVNYGGFL